MGYISPWGHKESDTTEQLHSLHSVAFIVLLCGPFILQCIVNFVTQRLMLLSQIGVRRVRVQYISMNDAHTMSKEHQEEGMKEETDRTGSILKARLHLESRAPSWAGLWTLSYIPSIYGNHIPTGKPGPQGSYLDSLLPKRIPQLSV